MHGLPNLKENLVSNDAAATDVCILNCNYTAVAHCSPQLSRCEPLIHA